MDIFISYSFSRLSFASIENDYLPRNIHKPMAMKARAATFLRIFWGMTAIRPSPKSTPSSVTRHKAQINALQAEARSLRSQIDAGNIGFS
jgi:hypothetical protein